MLGIIGRKVGMTQVYSEGGSLLPVTLVKISPNVVIGKRTLEKDGYQSVIVGTEDLKAKHTTKPYKGIFGDIVPKRILKEFRMDDVAGYEKGQEVALDIFDDVKFVDVSGLSSGKGFQGVMKRWGFHGGRATHGSKFHRQNGSTGNCEYPGRVFKGLKRAGRMGFEKVTIQSLNLVSIDKEKNIMVIKGALPGKKNTELVIKKACKKN